MGVGLNRGGVPMRGGGVKGCKRPPHGGRIGPELGMGVPGALDVKDVGISMVE